MAIKVFGMDSCPDCIAVKSQIEGNEDFEYIDIGSHVHRLKEFVRLRDSSPVFDEAKRNGSLGIPCFVKEDGSVTLKPEDVGLLDEIASFCSIEDHRAGKKGC